MEMPGESSSLQGVVDTPRESTSYQDTTTAPVRIPYKRKTRQYSEKYLKFGFIQSFTNVTLPLCLLCEKTFANEAMKPSKLKEHQMRIHPDSLDYDISFFFALKEQMRNRLIESVFPFFNSMVSNTVPLLSCSSSRIQL